MFVCPWQINTFIHSLIFITVNVRLCIIMLARKEHLAVDSSNCSRWPKCDFMSEMLVLFWFLASSFLLSVFIKFPWSKWHYCMLFVAVGRCHGWRGTASSSSLFSMPVCFSFLLCTNLQPCTRWWDILTLRGITVWSHATARCLLTTWQLSTLSIHWTLSARCADWMI